jgi:peptidoglycan hydrolase-like protein with peptidoglycan-binding domain
MKNTYVKTLLGICMLVFMLAGAHGASAQTAVQYTGGQCSPFTYNMSYGGRGGDVARMQSYLIAQGYLANGSATGYFGTLTLAAVKRFQSAHGISPTGFFGDSTRTALYNAACTDQQVPGNPNNPSNPTSYAPVITSFSPSSGPFGTTITIYGRNFGQYTNNAINFAGVNNIAVNKVSYDGTTLQFTVPASPCPQTSTICTLIALAPGQYPISVTNSNGTSNSMMFTVTAYGNGNGGNTGTQAPVISSIDGSTTLTVGQAGAWSIRASDPSNIYGNGSLSYSVRWGDEGSQTYSSTISSSNTNFVQNATFNHTYYNPGTYTVVFTVRNGNGQETKSSITVLVTGYSTNSTPVITSVSPTSGPFGTQVTVTGRNFSSYDNVVNFAGVNRAYTGVSSYDGTTLRFTPTATPCTSGNVCAQVALNPGTYTISVTNANGTSNLMNYTVTGSGTDTSTTTTEQIVELSVGQSSVFKGITVRPEAVVTDSRCAVDVTCIQAGRVVVRTLLWRASNFTYANLSSDATSPSVTSDGYKVQIIGVTPIKYSTQTIAQNQYKIKYRISR